MPQRHFTESTDRQLVWRIALLCGGDSAEREVSLRSGACVEDALRSAGYAVEVFDPRETAARDIDWPRFDACFLALHGGAGEDGRIQAELESLGVAFTGSGSAASRLAMSKSASKERFRQHGLPAKPYRLLRSVGSAHLNTDSFPIIVKPDAEGSSLGVSYVESETELRVAIERAFDVADAVMIEPFIAGREFTVAVLGRRALPLLEIVKPDACFSYEDKYQRKAAELRFDTNLPGELTQRIEQLAVAAAAALDTAGLVRVDLMLDAAGQPWLLEVNTIPGLTSRSLAPLAAAEAGLSFSELCCWCVDDCLARQEEVA